MTRINCVPPSELCTKHLVSEYHELPRVFGLVRRLLEKGRDPADVGAPEAYTLGTGHVKFFYTRLGWCLERQADLIFEMLSRGLKPRLEDVRSLAKGLPKRVLGGWEPTPEALELNRARLKERLAEMENAMKTRTNKKDAENVS
jgi:deoxyribonuclease (pyrimidine dimer)